MNSYDIIDKDYFDWLCDLVCGNRYSDRISYKKLLSCLYNTDFYCLVARDEDRAEDGIYMRYRFILDCDVEEYKMWLKDRSHDPCSVLEMMVALAVRCEETIMNDPQIGDRTGQWFWGMIVNLGLGSMTDDRYHDAYVKGVLIRFLNREYDENGKGGLFTVRNTNKDLRHVEIWNQMCWYLDSFT